MSSLIVKNLDIKLIPLYKISHLSELQRGRGEGYVCKMLVDQK